MSEIKKELLAHQPPKKISTMRQKTEQVEKRKKKKERKGKFFKDCKCENVKFHFNFTCCHFCLSPIGVVTGDVL